MDETSAHRFAEAVREASRRADVGVVVDAVYQHLQDAIEIRRPVCSTSGRCCRFDEFGHRLFVTTLEMAHFVAQNQPLPRRARTGGCVFQEQGLCSVHSIRPFGCRIFFCDETSANWQQEQYERFHRLLKTRHEELNVPYYYVEWREALSAMAIGDAVAGPTSALTCSGL